MVAGPLLGGLLGGVGSAIPGIFGSIFGGGKQKDAAKDALEWQKDQARHLRHGSKSLARDQYRRIEEKDRQGGALAEREYNKMLDLARQGFGRDSRAADSAFGANVRDIRNLGADGRTTIMGARNANLRSLEDAQRDSVRGVL